jgi:membrane protease YdiL (CAAX protease family)
MAVARPEASTDELFRATLLAVGLGLGLFVIGAIVASIVVLAVLGGDVQPGDPRQTIIGTLVLQGVFFLGGGVLYLRLRDEAAPAVAAYLPSARQVGVGVVGLVVLIALLFGVQALLSLFDVTIAESSIIQQGVGQPWLYLVLIPASVLIVGPGEELVFRGLVQGHLREVYSAPAGVLIASGVFAVVHVSSFTGPGAAASLALVFTLALVLGGLYEYTDNLVVPALVHGVFNALQFLVRYLEVTGGLSLA